MRRTTSTSGKEQYCMYIYSTYLEVAIIRVYGLGIPVYGLGLRLMWIYKDRHKIQSAMMYVCIPYIFGHMCIHSPCLCYILYTSRQPFLSVESAVYSLSPSPAGAACPIDPHTPSWARIMSCHLRKETSSTSPTPFLQVHITNR